jgi:signal transduction histidine kinase
MAMDSLVLRVTVAISAAAAVPTLAAILLPLLQTQGLSAASVMLLAGWTFIVIGLIGVMAFLVARALMRPIAEVTAFLNPAATQLLASRKSGRERVPQELRMLRAAVFGRDAIRRHEASERATFVLTLIHDMKTPLIAVDRSLELVQTEASAEARRPWLDAARLEVERLLKLVQDVVDAERLASGAMAVHVQETDLESLCRRVVERVAHLREEVCVRIHAVGLHRSSGDPALLERAIENILVNAVRHARSEVIVNLTPGLVRVADDGRGMEGDVEALELAPRDRGARTFTASSVGKSSGLGLFIAKRILEAHGGRLVVESTGPRGTAVLLYVGGAPRRSMT